MPEAQREELRLALVMNGGVSLAVWMGGVTNEIFRLVKQTHPVYRMLLDLTHTDARVDVISGTSAGGVNGAALSVAMLYDGDFSQLRSVWMETGSFTDLLRSPMGENPGSLLQGDEFFLQKLEEALERLVPPNEELVTPEDVPIDLRLTTTLLTGRQVNTIDDLGTPVHDVDYRAYFHFEHKSNVTDFDDPSVVIPKLARAARSTASFPFAFEPSYLTPENAGNHLRGYGDRPLPVPRYVIDGGVLNNKPFEGARQAIFEMRTDRSVRRVLAYINPDPGDGPPGQLGGKQPTLAKVLVEGVFGIPQSQTIADQLDAIEAHNEEVRKRRDSVLTLVAMDKLDKSKPKVQARERQVHTLERLAGQLYGIYHKRRLASTFDLFVFKQLTDAAERKPALAKGLNSIGRRGRSEMKRAFETYGDCAQPGGSTLGWLPADWPKQPDDPAFTRDRWAWGLFPVEFAAKILLDMLRMTQRLLDSGSPSTAPFEARQAQAPTTDANDWSDPDSKRQPVPRPLDQVRKDMASFVNYFRSPTQPNGITRPTVRRRVPPNARAPSTVGGDPDAQAKLEVLWKRAYKIITDLSELRSFEQKTWWDPGAEMLLGALAVAVEKGGITEEISSELIHTLYPRMFGFLDLAPRRDACADLVFRVAQVIHDLHGIAITVTDAVEVSPNLRPSECEVVEDLRNLTNALCGDARSDLTSTLVVLCQLEVVQFAFNDHDSLSADTLIELVQISGNGESPLGGCVDAKDKLLGLQLAHFGAFYKKSWRANDWLYGRLGGSERLVRILLSPDRLHRCFMRRPDLAVAAIRTIAVDSCPAELLRAKLDAAWQANGSEALIAQELAFLERPEANLPDALPHCARAITLRLHYGILNEELPYLIDAIHTDQSDGAEATGPGNVMLRELGVADAADVHAAVMRVSPELAQRWLRSGLIASETLLGQAGSDLFTRTVAHTAATLQNTIASKATGLGPVSAFFATLKLPIIGFFLASKGLLAQSRTGAALNGGVLVLGMALVLFEFLWKPTQLTPDALPHSLVVIGWALLAYGLIVSLLRTPRTFTVVLLAIVAAIGFFVPLLPYVPFVVLLVLIFLSVSFVWLQTVVGLIAIAVAAAWGSGWIEGTLGNAPQVRSDDYRVDVLVFATTVVLTLLWAILQSSSIPRRRLESLFGKRFTLGLARGHAIASFGMRVRIETHGWIRRRIRRVVVVELETGQPAYQARVAVGDSIVELNHRPVEDMDVSTFTALLAQGPVVGLTLARDRTSVERIEVAVVQAPTPP